MWHNRVAQGNRRTATLQGFLLFGIAVAGKSADTTVQKVKELLQMGGWNPEDEEDIHPFSAIRYLMEDGTLEHALREVKIGQYGRIYSAYHTVTDRIDVHRTSVADLEAVRGIGPKTARYFMMYAHGLECAALDTHILRYMREVMQIGGVPKSTPSGAKYAFLEELFVTRARELQLTVSQLDDRIWRYYARGEGELP